MDSVDRPSRDRPRKPSIEGLEDRNLLSAAMPDIAMVSATTADSRGVTFEYDVKNAGVDAPILFAIDRSAEAGPNKDEVPVGSLTVVPPGPAGGQGTLDLDGRSATALGDHRVTVPLPGGLPPDPTHPFVLVTADPNNTIQESNKGDDTASFRTHVIGVITHGGLQLKAEGQGPPWELRMAAELRAEGYDTVVPYSWVADSNIPGMAVKQGPKLAAIVEKAASQFPATDPVDVHFIGHSEGAVVNSQALLRMNRDGLSPALKAGYLKMTMLDPHAASNNVPGPQYSVQHGPIGWLARQEIDAFQSKAKDPAVVVPANVQEADVFYQRNPVSQTNGANGGVYNLWGQVPVSGRANYYDLTAPGISHSGRFGVQDWYRLNVVPTLGVGAPQVRADAVTGGEVAARATRVGPGARQSVSYAGASAPGSTVRLLVARGVHDLKPVGRTHAGPDGSWRLTTRPLTPGQYRVVAVSRLHHVPGQRTLSMRPTAWLPPLNVADGRPTA